jgi:hypothetical protein
MPRSTITTFAISTIVLKFLQDIIKCLLKWLRHFDHSTKILRRTKNPGRKYLPIFSDERQEVCVASQNLMSLENVLVW